MSSVTRVLTCQVILRRGFHNTTSCLAGGNWRAKRGEGQCGNEYGPMVDIPDWSYADGRPAPMGYGERRRQEQNRTFGKRAVELMSELKEMKTQYNTKQTTDTKIQQVLRGKSKT